MDTPGNDDSKKIAREEMAEYMLFLKKVKAVFGTQNGMDVLDWLLEACGYADTIFTGNSRTYYQSGRQDVGREIMAEVTKADPQIHHQMIDRWCEDANRKMTEEVND